MMEQRFEPNSSNRAAVTNLSMEFRMVFIVAAWKRKKLVLSRQVSSEEKAFEP
jgi:hypothetical protein